MKLPLYQIDAFTNHIFGGNPACIVPLEAWLPDATLLNIAKENAVAETAFFIPLSNGNYHLRWFTPEIEMDLCGHATLATAHYLKVIAGSYESELVFETPSGHLKVSEDNGWYTMDLPSRMPEPASLPTVVGEALSQQPKAVFKSRDYVLVYETEQEVRQMEVDKGILDKINLDPGGVIVTAAGEDCDFVSRFFTPQASILEDPVTGSAHCSLVPYWEAQLGKSRLVARQISERGGFLKCENLPDRVLLSGQARTYSEGIIWVD